MWWSGLAKREAGEAIALAALDVDRAIPAARKATVHLLPPFDEYTVGYKNRSAVIDPSFAKKVNAGGGIINAIVVIDGIVAGSWKRTLRGRSVELRVTPFRALRDSERRGVEQEAARYARFLRTDFSVTISRDLP